MIDERKQKTTNPNISNEEWTKHLTNTKITKILKNVVSRTKFCQFYKKPQQIPAFELFQPQKKLEVTEHTNRAKTSEAK